MRADKQTTVSAAMITVVNIDSGDTNGQDQPGILQHREGQMTQHQHCAVQHVLKEQCNFLIIFWLQQL